MTPLATSTRNGFICIEMDRDMAVKIPSISKDASLTGHKTEQNNNAHQEAPVKFLSQTIERIPTLLCFSGYYLPIPRLQARRNT